jgi:hypothetical protein
VRGAVSGRSTPDTGTILRFCHLLKNHNLKQDLGAGDAWVAAGATSIAPASGFLTTLRLGHAVEIGVKKHPARREEPFPSPHSKSGRSPHARRHTSSSGTWRRFWSGA